MSLAMARARHAGRASSSKRPRVDHLAVRLPYLSEGRLDQEIPVCREDRAYQRLPAEFGDDSRDEVRWSSPPFVDWEQLRECRPVALRPGLLGDVLERLPAAAGASLDKCPREFARRRQS